MKIIFYIHCFLDYSIENSESVNNFCFYCFASGYQDDF